MNLSFNKLQPHTSEEQFFGSLMALLDKVPWEETAMGAQGLKLIYRDDLPGALVGPTPVFSKQSQAWQKAGVDCQGPPY